jgi:hypothetical protein
MYEYRNGRRCRTVQALYSDRGSEQGHYREGDAIDGGRYDLRQLKKSFPGVKVQDEEVTVWNLVDAVVFGCPTVKDYQVKYLINTIEFDTLRPWVGSITVSAFFQLDEVWIPLEQSPKDKRLNAWANGGHLNQMLPQLALCRSLRLSQMFLSGALALANNMLGGRARTLARGSIAGKALLRSKFIGNLKRLRDKVEKDRVANATFAFCETFASSLHEEVKADIASFRKLAVLPALPSEAALAETTLRFASTYYLAISNPNAGGAVNPREALALRKAFLTALSKALLDFLLCLLIPKTKQAKIEKKTLEYLRACIRRRMHGAEQLVEGIGMKTVKVLSDAIATATVKAFDTKGTDLSSFKENLKNALEENVIKFLSADAVHAIIDKCVEFETEK